MKRSDTRPAGSPARRKRSAGTVLSRIITFRTMAVTFLIVYLQYSLYIQSIKHSQGASMTGTRCRAHIRGQAWIISGRS